MDTGASLKGCASQESMAIPFPVDLRVFVFKRKGKAMRRRILGVAGLLGLALAGAALAQDDAILLRYHFQPGQEYRYRITMNGEMPTTLGGPSLPAGASMPKIPVTVHWTMELSQKIKSVTPDGAAVVSVGIDKMEMTSGMMGMNIVTRLGAGGKLETLMNGQPFALPNMPAAAIPNPFYEATIDSTGKTSGISSESAQALSQLFKGQNLALMFNGLPGMGGLFLPEKPIKPGDTWDSTYKVQLPVQMPGPAAGAAGGAAEGATIPLSFAVHNKLARVENGSAVIETQMSANSSPGTKMAFPGVPGNNPGMSMTLQKMSQALNGSLRFRTEQGAMESGDYDARLAMQMDVGLPPGVAGAAPGAPDNGGAKQGAAGEGAAPAPAGLQIGVDGTLKLKIERLGAAQAPPAARAPPAAQ
jgi:hypothetical protein